MEQPRVARERDIARPMPLEAPLTFGLDVILQVCMRVDVEHVEIKK